MRTDSFDIVDHGDGGTAYADGVPSARSATSSGAGLSAAGPTAPHHPDDLATAPGPVLRVILADEMARAQNVGLNGCARCTTPEPAAVQVVSFPDTASCGTSSAVSLPDAFQQTRGLDRACLARHGTEPQSHDVMFHTVLGLLDILPSARDPALDLTSEPRSRV